MFIDLRERNRERERDRCERETSIYCFLYAPTHLDQGVNLQPRHIPWLGIKPATFWCTTGCSNQLRHVARAKAILMAPESERQKDRQRNGKKQKETQKSWSKTFHVYF